MESIDTTTSSGCLIFHIFGALAEFELNLIRERALAGLWAAQARGLIGGRPKKLGIQKTELAYRLYDDKIHTYSQRNMPDAGHFQTNFVRLPRLNNKERTMTTLPFMEKENDMGSHPINLAVRFLLELAALIAIGYWSWHQGEGFLSIVFAIGFPVIAAVLWGTFAVPDDPSRSGKAPVPIPGLLRLALEAGFFGFAVGTLFDAVSPWLGLFFAVMVLLHYVFSYDRLQWLAKQK